MSCFCDLIFVWEGIQGRGAQLDEIAALSAQKTILPHLKTALTSLRPSLQNNYPSNKTIQEGNLFAYGFFDFFFKRTSIVDIFHLNGLTPI